MPILRTAISSRTASPKQSAHFNAPPSASWRVPDFLAIRYNIALLKGDQDEMERAVGLARGKSRAEHWMVHAEALALARSGRLQAARRSSSRAVDLALQEGEREAAASYQAARAVWEAVYVNAAEAKRNAIAALALSSGRDVKYAAGLALAFAGDSSRSQPLADDLEKRFPEDTFAKFTYVPVLRALSALEDGKPTDSVERLQIALPYELAVNGLNFNHLYLGGLHSAYVRGEALMAAHQYAEAAAEFQKILDHRGIVGADPIGALAHLTTGQSVRAGPEIWPSRRLPTRISSPSGTTRIPTSRSSRRPRRNTRDCNNRTGDGDRSGGTSARPPASCPDSIAESVRATSLCDLVRTASCKHGPQRFLRL